MNTIQKRKQDLDQSLYVDLVHQWKAQRPRRPHDNVVRFPTRAAQKEPEDKPIPQGLTVGGTAAILLALLALAAVLIALGVAG